MLSGCCYLSRTESGQKLRSTSDIANLSQNSLTEVPSILTVSYTAGEFLDLMLAEANAPHDAVIRVIVNGLEVSFKIGTAQPSDTTFDHEGKAVLAIDEQTSELLADMHFDVEVTGEKSELVLIEQLEE